MLKNYWSAISLWYNGYLNDHNASVDSKMGWEIMTALYILITTPTSEKIAFEKWNLLII